MTEKQPMQANGARGVPQQADAISGKPGAGESPGAAYPNPHTGKGPNGFDGGQSDKSYSGPDNPNATTK
jgi:hypothetical protein